jgi:hypothetical protein
VRSGGSLDQALEAGAFFRVTRHFSHRSER